jgi:hypothetical protein
MRLMFARKGIAFFYWLDIVPVRTVKEFEQLHMLENTFLHLFLAMNECVN